MRRLLLALLLAAPAAAKDSPMTWKTEKNESFSCDLPQLWRGGKAAEGGAAWFYTDGLRSIRAAKVAGDAKALFAERKAEQPDAAASTVTVLGKPADKLQRRYRERTGGDEGPGPSEWVYEETVVAPAKSGAWTLEFQSRSPGRSAKPKGLDAWKRFLASFQPK